MTPRDLETLKRIQEERAPVYFSGNGSDATFETRIIGVDHHRLTIANRVPPDYISRVVPSTSFSLQCQMLKFAAKSIDTDGVAIFFPLDEQSSLEGTRHSERFPFAQEEKVVCEFTNPFDQETRIVKRVIDMSATGLSLRTPLETKLFQPGLTIPQMTVLIDGKPYVKAAARVVYRRKLIDYRGGLRLQVGLQFLTPVGESP